MIKQNPNPSPIEKMWFGLSCFGGDKRDRTADLLNAIHSEMGKWGSWMIWIENGKYSSGFTCERACRKHLLEYVSEREFSVAQLELSPRARNVLRLNGILVTLGQLLRVDRAEASGCGSDG